MVSGLLFSGASQILERQNIYDYDELGDVIRCPNRIVEMESFSPPKAGKDASSGGEGRISGRGRQKPAILVLGASTSTSPSWNVRGVSIRLCVTSGRIGSKSVQVVATGAPRRDAEVAPQHTTTPPF
jgi:hypothetical protein